jgi:hypothetical protein
VQYTLYKNYEWANLEMGQFGGRKESANRGGPGSTAWVGALPSPVRLIPLAATGRGPFAPTSEPGTPVVLD